MKNVDFSRSHFETERAGDVFWFTMYYAYRLRYVYL